MGACFALIALSLPIDVAMMYPRRKATFGLDTPDDTPALFRIQWDGFGQPDTINPPFRRVLWVLQYCAGRLGMAIWCR